MVVRFLVYPYPAVVYPIVLRPRPEDRWQIMELDAESFCTVDQVYSDERGITSHRACVVVQSLNDRLGVTKGFFQVVETLHLAWICNVTTEND